MRGCWFQRRRRLAEVCTAALSLAAAAAILVPILQMLWLVTSRGMRTVSPSLLTRVTSGLGGGIANAIAGSFLLAALAAAMATSAGILGGIYTSQFARRRASAAVRLSADVLAGVPGIVLGYVGFVTLVTRFGWGFSTLAGALVLAVLMLPYTLRASDVAMSQVPDGLSDAALCLGASDAVVVARVVVPAALPGIVSGSILAVSIALGETAALAYTAGWSGYFPSLRLIHSPVAYLTYVVWSFGSEPFASSRRLAYGAALVLMAIVLLLNVTAQWVLFRWRRARA